jgi:hypothetical protein
MVLIAAVSVTALVSCGGGGSDGGTDGTICAQCGDSDGLCLETEDVTGDDRPSFCGDTDPCTVRLRCLRKLDSAQRRCFPANPATNELDLAYKCDGSRPNPSVAPTTTATPEPTSTPEPTLTPSATAITPTPTVSSTPAATATPSDAETVDVTINIETQADDLPATFSATVSYPAAKGNVKDENGKTDCDPDDGGTVTDNGNGTLSISFDIDPADFGQDVSIACVFHQVSGQTLTNADLGKTVTPSSLSIDIEDFS